MDYNDIFKQLKSITPDADYTRRSRRAILKTGYPTARRFGVFSYIGTMIAEGSAIALAGVLLLLIMTGFSTWEFLSPFELKSLDPASLRAEAEAIDIQVQLTQLAYPDLHRNETTTAIQAATGTRIIEESAIKAEVREQAKQLGITAASSSEEKSTSINDALDQLVK